MNTGSNWIELASVLPRGDPYRQAKQLIRYGILHERWLLIPAVCNNKSAHKLADSVDTMTCRAIQQWNRGSNYFPHGILMLERNAMTFRASYHPDYKAGISIPITLIEATGNPHNRAQCVLQSGIASSKFIFVTGRFTEVVVHVSYLHQAVLRGSINGVRIVEPRPLGIMVCTHIRWGIAHDYTQMYSSDA